MRRKLNPIIEADILELFRASPESKTFDVILSMLPKKPKKVELQKILDVLCQSGGLMRYKCGSLKYPFTQWAYVHCRIASEG